VKRGTSNGGPYTLVATPAAASYIDAAVSSGATYYYVVSAVNVGGETANPAQVVAAPVAPPPAPGLDQQQWRDQLPR
jgi:fibronectin type 3 domain-containing protein